MSPKPPFSEPPQGPAVSSSAGWHPTPSRPAPPSPSPSLSPGTPPRALLFDIGGVVVVSPFAAILAYERSLSIPPGFINFSLSRHSPGGAWHRLERGEIPCDAAFFRQFTAELTKRDLWEQWCVRHGRMTNEGVVPALPAIDGEWLYWEMMRISRAPDPHMFPAVAKIKASGRFLVAALSNTSIFPEGHAFHQPVSKDVDVKSLFEPFVSSAHVGLRKPDPRIYELALEMMRQRPGFADLQPGQVLFLDDIGENLKAGRAAGFQTLKVHLGKTRDAVKALEAVTGLELASDAAKL